MDRHTLLYEDFSTFPIGEFPYDRDHSALGEYHYVTEPGYRGIWSDQVCNHTWNGTGPTWIITSTGGLHSMECMRVEKGRPHRIFPTLEAGSPYWRDIRVSCRVRRLSLRGMAGVAFCMNHSLDTLVFGIENRDQVRLVWRHKEELHIRAQASFPSDSDRDYLLEAECLMGRIRCYVDGELLLEADTALALRGGHIGITADCPTRFTQIQVTASEEELQDIALREKAALEAAQAAQAQHPSMKLWRKLDLKDFGTSRQLRFGHLLGDGSWQIVLAQMQKRVSRDAYGFISCLTAIDLEGNVLWQLGEPSTQSQLIGKVCADMPLQVYDIDGDGFDEVIVGWDFEIRILDGRTGAVKKAVKTPIADEDDEGLLGVPYGTYAFHRLNPDGIRICNFRGLDRPRDLLIKDRYCRVWALDENLNLLWQYKSPTNTGHCPLNVDIDGNGHDEVLVGYRLLSHEGKELWHYPIFKDHTDEIVAGRWMPGDMKGHFACVSGTQGFFIGDFSGNIVARDLIGHAQRISVANYCPEREGLEIAVTNFWGHQGCVYLYDAFGTPIWELHNGMNGNIIAPVNWDGSGTELILTNPDPHKGGLLDGNGQQAVLFPDDGHPVLCCEVQDLTGDKRDELIVWDYRSLWIYTQADNPKPQTYNPIKAPTYNASNYRGEYAYPNESYLCFRKEPDHE